jgi:hypothetical protein
MERLAFRASANQALDCAHDLLPCSRAGSVALLIQTVRPLRRVEQRLVWPALRYERTCRTPYVDLLHNLSLAASLAAFRFRPINYLRNIGPTAGIIAGIASRARRARAMLVVLRLPRLILMELAHPALAVADRAILIDHEQTTREGVSQNLRNSAVVRASPGSRLGHAVGVVFAHSCCTGWRGGSCARSRRRAVLEAQCGIGFVGGRALLCWRHGFPCCGAILHRVGMGGGREQSGERGKSYRAHESFRLFWPMMVPHDFRLDNGGGFVLIAFRRAGHAGTGNYGFRRASIDYLSLPETCYHKDPW